MSKPLHTLFALSIIFIVITCYAESSNTSSTQYCAPSQCGNVSISYPFWMRSHTNDATEFCGYPDFGLECSEGKAIINLPSDTYYAPDINYENHSITLVDIDILDQECPRARNNVTIKNLPLSFNSLDLNLSFYFNCSSYPSFVDPIGCWRVSGDNRKSYVFVEGGEDDGGGFDDWHCEEHVVVTVKGDEVDVNGGGGLINGFGAAMKKGFVLDWRRAEDCAQCEVSGGYCGFDQNTKQSTCICRNGSVVAKSCKKGTLILT